MSNLGADGLSVIIPTHNGRESVLDTVNAILSDGHPELEVLVISDGASERTRAIISDVSDSRVRLVAKNKEGSAAARNYGLLAAQYDWVAFVDDDDVPRANWVQTWLGAAKTGAQVVTGSVARHSSNGATSVRPSRLDPSDPTMAASTLLAGGFWIKKDLLNAIGGYDLELRAAQNQDLGLRLCDHLARLDPPPRIHHVDEPVIDVFVQEAAARDRRYGVARADSARLFLSRHQQRLAVDPKHRASLLRIIARAERLQHRHLASIRTALQAVRTEPTNLPNYRSLLLALVPPLANIGHDAD